MLKRVVGICLLSLLLITGCRKHDARVVAVIAGRDTITTFELQGYAKRNAGIASSEITYDEQIQMVNKLIWLHRKALEVRDQDPQAVPFIDSIMRTERDAMLEDIFFNREVIAKEVNAEAIDRYRRYTTYSVTYQVLQVGYQSPNYPSSARTQQQAKRMMDSVAAVISYSNFETLARQYSEYAHPKFGKLSPVKVSFDELPLKIQRVIFSDPSKRVTPLIEIPDAYLIMRILSIDAPPTPPTFGLSRRSIEKKLRQKLITTEEYYYVQLISGRVDELFRAVGIRFDSSAWTASAIALKGGKKFAELQRSFAERPPVLASWADGRRTTLLDVMQQFSDEAMIPAFSSDVIGRLTREYVQRITIRDYMTRQGTAEFQEAAWEEAFRFRSYLAQMGPGKPVKRQPDEGQIRAYYDSHVAEFIQPAEALYTEFICYDRASLMEAMQLFESGIDPVKIKDDINRKNKDNSRKQIAVVNRQKLTLSEDSEVARYLTRLTPGSSSDILPKADGRLAFYVVSEKKDARLMTFYESKEKAREAWVAMQKRLDDGRQYKELALRYPVVIYDQPIRF